jgi:RHH-type proline utilization regulon transcriptional repressor/proline dehydrogenase/delta 1-pyrroline-5-carboxylate dehydrogenase
MRARGHAVERARLGPETANGTFVAPTIIEVNGIADVEREVFGPVLHVMRYRRAQLDRLVSEINAAGYGLTFGLHTRIDETIEQVVGRIAAGNVYVNRNIIGAVVGSQPFGGRGLSGTGPKAGGPLYLPRLTAGATDAFPTASRDTSDSAAFNLARWLQEQGHLREADHLLHLAGTTPVGTVVELPGPVGEENRYLLKPRGTILIAPLTVRGLHRQLAVVLATGNRAAIMLEPSLESELRGLPQSVSRYLERINGAADAGPLAGALIEGDAARVLEILDMLSRCDGPLIPAQAATSGMLAGDANPYRMSLLVEEVSISTNTAAAGGNASLMTLGQS